MNNRILILTLLLISVNSPAVIINTDSSFNYQGELLDNGSPANDTYDFQVIMLDGIAQQIGITSQHDAVNVVNGLFSLNVDFDIPAFDGFENYYIEISVRKTSVGGAYTTLEPIQEIQAVPLATNLTNGSASVGQVLTFNGSEWNPANPPQSPWSVNGSNEVYFNTANVGIGTSNPAHTLHVQNTSVAQIARFDGGDRMWVSFSENGTDLGFIGSYTTELGTNDDDFEIGTYSDNNNGGLQFTIQGGAAMTVANTRKVGIGTTNPISKLQVQSTDENESPLAVNVGAEPRFQVKGDGSSNFYGDTKQNAENNGQLKFMVDLNCSNSSSSVHKYYNGTQYNGAVTVSDGPSVGKCYVSFPTFLTDRYWSVSAYFNSEPRGASCSISSGSFDLILQCVRYDPVANNMTNGNIMILVY